MRQRRYETGFYDGVIATLDVVAAYEGADSATYTEIVQNCGPKDCLRKAAIRADVVENHPSLFAPETA